MSCVFLSEDIFIIHIFDKYEIDCAVETISTCIGFNRLISGNTILLQENINYIKKYKGIVIFKDPVEFTTEYIISDIHVKNSFQNMHISPRFTLSDNYFDENMSFIKFIKLALNNFIFENNISYYNSAYVCGTYEYLKDHKTKLDLSILIHSFSQIEHKDCIDYIEFSKNVK